MSFSFITRDDAYKVLRDSVSKTYGKEHRWFIEVKVVGPHPTLGLVRTTYNKPLTEGPHDIPIWGENPRGVVCELVEAYNETVVVTRYRPRTDEEVTLHTVDDRRIDVVYEIVNPSDRATLVASDERLARIATVLISPQYGLIRCSDDHMVGNISLFGMSEEGFVAAFGETLEHCLSVHSTEIADILDSVQLGGPKDRCTDGDRVAIKEERRTSLTDFVQYAWSIADSLRARGES